MIEGEAKSLLGHQQASWPALQAATIAHKAAGDSPLLETGGMRDSISHTSSPQVAYVGSNSDKAVWQELGTSKIPPRPFLALAATNKEKAVVKMIGRRIADYLAAGHSLSHALHELKKTQRMKSRVSPRTCSTMASAANGDDNHEIITPAFRLGDDLVVAS